MDASQTGFADQTFDLVCCLQNGISAFHVDQLLLLQESLRITKQNGTILFSSYADQFWDDRLEWFHIQAQYGLIGEIDEAATGNGVIVCKDGFKATTVSPDQFLSLAKRLGTRLNIHIVENSSVFCEIIK